MKKNIANMKVAQRVLGIATILGSLAILLSFSTAASEGADLKEWLENQKKENKPQMPDRIVCVWTNGTKITPGKKTTRGMGGRLMFYSDKFRTPVKVDGEVSIYAFVDEEADPRYNIPQKKYVFTSETLPLHYSKSSLGHSYSFFIEWGKIDGPDVPLTLIVRFQNRAGKVVTSDASRQTLPGLEHNPEQMFAAESTSIKQTTLVPGRKSKLASAANQPNAPVSTKPKTAVAKSIQASNRRPISNRSTASLSNRTETLRQLHTCGSRRSWYLPGRDNLPQAIACRNLYKPIGTPKAVFLRWFNRPNMEARLSHEVRQSTTPDRGNIIRLNNRRRSL